MGLPEQYLSIIWAGPTNTIPEACGANLGKEISECGSEAMGWDSVLIYQESLQPPWMWGIRGIQWQYKCHLSHFWVESFACNLFYMKRTSEYCSHYSIQPKLLVALYEDRNMKKYYGYNTKDLNTGDFSFSIDSMFDLHDLPSNTCVLSWISG